MARIAWRDLAGAASLEVTLADVSLLAECIIDVAARFAVAHLEPRFGRPRDVDGRELPLLVLGMGKLGGKELNFSSDVDFVFVYPDAEVTGLSIEPEEYYVRLGQLLIRLLDQRTEDGFAYRVDTRLRPFGASGPLAVNLGAFESYLVEHGRDWERYAYVKARLLTGQEFERDVFDLVPPMSTLTPSGRARRARWIAVFSLLSSLVFGAVAPPSQVVMPVDRETGRPRGFAFVEFLDRAHAEQAIHGRGVALAKSALAEVNAPQIARPSSESYGMPLVINRPPILA